MSTNPSKDYYDILGVPKNATPEQIKEAYRKLIKENHPDQYTGTRKKYEQAADPDLLKIIDEKIATANEKTQQINESYDVLSDPDKRAAYDRTLRSAATSATSTPPLRPRPEIVLSATSLNFGSVAKGDKKTRSFTIDNQGGMPDEIHIDWETVPTWAGELLIEPHPTHTFPIKVIVEVKPAKVPVGSYTGRIVVIVDREEFSVAVSVNIVMPAAAPVPVSPPSTPRPAPGPARPTPAPAPVYTAPSYSAPSTPTNVPWGLIITLMVIVGIVVLIIAVTGSLTGSSQQNNLGITGSNWQIVPDSAGSTSGTVYATFTISNNSSNSQNVWLWTNAVVKTIDPQKGACVYSNCAYELKNISLQDKQASSSYNIGPHSSITVNTSGQYYAFWGADTSASLNQICAHVGVGYNNGSTPYTQWLMEPGVACFSSGN